jgi:hypothetical protein
VPHASSHSKTRTASATMITIAWPYGFILGVAADVVLKGGV